MKTTPSVPSVSLSFAPGLSWISVSLTVCLLGLMLLSVQGQTLVLSNKWNIPTGTRVYIGTSTGHPRGIAFNPTTGNLVIATPNPSNTVWVINGVDGSDLGQFQFLSTDITGGTLALTKTGVADDGVVYACNLSVADTFKIYRWDSENTISANPPMVAFGPASTGPDAMRIGDSFDVRGAGTNTQIIASGGNSGSIQSTNFAVFTTSDGTNFTAVQFRLPPGVPAGGASRTLGFDGTNSAFYASPPNSSTFYHVGFDLNTTNAILLSTITNLSPAIAMGSLATTNGIKMLAGIQDSGGATHRLIVFDISNPSSPFVVPGGNVAFPAPNAANINITGGTDIGAGMVVGLDSNNGILALSIGVETNVPPAITVHPLNRTVIEGGSAPFSVSASGTQPLHYQWFFNDTNALANATNATLSLTNVQSANAGNYKVVVTNIAGSATSSNALLTVTPGVFSAAQTVLWSLAPGSRSYLSTDYTTRGMAYNPVTDRLLLVSRAGAVTNIHVLNASTGADLYTLDITTPLFGPGTFLLNMIGVAEDGAVYAGNLTVSGSDYTLYRWADDSSNTVAGVAYGPDNPGIGRVGDTIAVRGGGTNTQIIVGSDNTAKAALFTTADGVNFSVTVIDLSTHVPAVPTGFAGLGIAFGKGNRFWAKHYTPFNLRHVFFDLGAGTNEVQHVFTGLALVSAIGVDNENDLLAGVAIENPDNLRLYDISDLTKGPMLIDQDFFAADNPNINANGAVAFDVSGGRLFALDVNNGLLAMKVVARLKQERQGNNLILRWTGPSALQSSTNVAGPYSDIGGATSPHTNSISATKFLRLRR